MRTYIFISIGLLLIFSCKNSSEEQPVADSTLNDLLEPEIEVIETDPEDPVEEAEEDEAKTVARSVFDVGENMIYIKKEDLNQEEESQLIAVLEKAPKLSEEQLIQDTGTEWTLKLPDLRSYLRDKPELFTPVRDLIERNIAPISVSKGYEIDGRQRIREYTGDKTGGFLEDMTEYYMFRGGRTGGTALRRLGVSSDENVVPILMEYFNVTEKELDMLKSFPGTENHSNSASAKQALEFELSETVSSYLKSQNCSQGFKDVVAYFKKRQQPAAKKFMAEADKAKKEFYKLNPGWYGEEGEAGVTYIDARRKYIYLPFGPLSFADTMVSHDLGSEGGNSEGVLHAPDMALETFHLADPRIGNLGLNGVLTISFDDNALTDVNGPDLYVFEMGKIEPTRLEISKDGKEWVDIGRIEGGTAMVDIGPFVKPGETFNYVRLTDLDTFSTVPGADVDAIAAIGGALRLNIDSAVLFDTGEFQLKENAAEELEKLLEAIMEIPKGTIIVEGHTDNVGSPESNLLLSKNRAKEVSNFLKEKLKEGYTFSIQGHGENRPVAANDSEENRQKNRRVEILVVPGKE